MLNEDAKVCLGSKVELFASLRRIDIRAQEIREGRQRKRKEEMGLGVVCDQICNVSVLAVKVQAQVQNVCGLQADLYSVSSGLLFLGF